MRNSISLANNNNLRLNALHSSGFSEYPTLLSYHSTLIYSLGNNLILESEESRQATLKSHDNTITTISLSPNRKLIITGQLPSPGNKNYQSPIIIWSIEKQQCVQVLNGLKDGVKKIVVSDDEKWIAGCSLKNQIIIWNLSNSQQIWLKNFEHPIHLFKFKPEALIFTHSKSLQQINLLPLFQSNKPPQINTYTNPSTGLPRVYLSLCQVDNDKYLLGTEGGEICFFDKGVFKWLEVIGKGRVHSIHMVESFIVAGVESEIIKLAIRQKGLVESKKTTIANAQQIIPYSNHFLVQSRGCIFQLNSSNLQTNLVKVSHSQSVTASATRNNIIATIDKAGTTLINKWNKNDTIELLSIYQTNKGAEGSCIYITEDYRVINGYSDGYLRCISTEGKLMWEINSHKNGVSTIWSNQQYMLSGGHDSVVRIWSTANKLINEISVHKKTVSKVLGDIKDTHIIHSSSFDRSIHTYDLKSDKKVNFRQLSNGSITDMAQTDDGLLVGIGMGLCLWDVKSIQPLQSMDVGNLRVIRIGVCGVLASIGTETGQIIIIDLRKRVVIGWWQAHSKEITSLKWLDQNTVVSSSADNSFMIWRL